MRTPAKLCQHVNSYIKYIKKEHYHHKAANKLNSQSLEDTQVEYISQKYTSDIYTFGKYTFGKYTFGKYTFEKYALRFTAKNSVWGPVEWVGDWVDRVLPEAKFDKKCT